MQDNKVAGHGVHDVGDPGDPAVAVCGTASRPDSSNDKDADGGCGARHGGPGGHHGRRAPRSPPPLAWGAWPDPGRWAPVQVTAHQHRPTARPAISWSPGATPPCAGSSCSIPPAPSGSTSTSGRPNVESQMQVRFESRDGHGRVDRSTRAGRARRRSRPSVRGRRSSGGVRGPAVHGISVRAGRRCPRRRAGYEAVDSVSWPVGPRRDWEPDQAAALAQWEMLKRLDASGDLSLTPQAARPSVTRGLPAATGRGLLAAVAAYVSLLALLGVTCARRPIRLAWMTSSLALAIVMGAGAMLALGRVGSGRAVTVHHRSVVQQIPGTDTALLSMRAVVEFPGAGPGGVAPARPRRGHRSVGAPRASGRAARRGRFSHSRRHVRARGTARLRRRGGGAREPARRGRSCGLSAHHESLAAHHGLMPPRGRPPAFQRRCTAPRRGHRSRAARGSGSGSRAGLGPVVLCETSAAAAPLTEASRPVIMRGTTIVAAYLARQSAPDEAGTP